MNDSTNPARLMWSSDMENITNPTLQGVSYFDFVSQYVETLRVLAQSSDNANPIGKDDAKEEDEWGTLVAHRGLGVQMII